jgi:hypothetical protein
MNKTGGFWLSRRGFNRQPQSFVRQSAWQFTPARIDREFRNLLYDPNADARTIRQSLETLKPEEFTTILQSRGVFTQAKIGELTAILDRVRQQVLAQVGAAEAAGMLEKTQTAIDCYLRSTPKHNLLSNASAQDFKTLLTDGDADPHELHARLS